MRVILHIVNIGAQIISTIPEISATDHSLTRFFDKSIEKTPAGEPLRIPQSLAEFVM